MSNAKSSRVHARQAAELSRPIIGGLVAIGLLLASSAANADLVYQENFDGLTAGRTQPFPGAAGQGGWYSALAQGSAFGEIQNTIANPGLALHEFAPLTNPASLQTIDSRDFSAVSVGGSPFISLSFDFYAHTSDLDTVNSFLAALEARGGPDPGFQILGVDLGAGNGTAKRLTGLNVSLGAFNGVDNNDPIPLTVGQVRVLARTQFPERSSTARRVDRKPGRQHHPRRRRGHADK